MLYMVFAKAAGAERAIAQRSSSLSCPESDWKGGHIGHLFFQGLGTCAGET